MPRGTLSFTLPEEKTEFHQAANAGRLASALHEIRRHLRGRRKYAELTPEALHEVEEAERIIGEADIEDLLE